MCQVFYKTGENMTQLHWFVKIPRSLQTVAMDERELVMYNTIFPKLKTFIKDNLKPGKLPTFTWKRTLLMKVCRRAGQSTHTHHLLLQLHGGRRQ